MPRKKKSVTTNAVTVRAKSLPGVHITGPVKLQSDQAFMTGTSTYDNMPVEVQQPYAKHPWVHAAIRAIATNAGGVPLKIETGTESSVKVITDESNGAAGDLARIFARPNEFDTSYQFMEKTFAIMNLDGWCIWVLDRENMTQIPKGMYAMRPGGFQPVLNPVTDRLLGWIYNNPNGSQEALDTSQVLNFKFFNPYDSIRGLSPLEAAQRGIRTDIYAKAYSEAFFYNSADPAGVITSEKKLSETQAQQIISWWEKRHRGPGSAKQIGILYGGMKWQATATSHKDMQFQEQLNENRDEILAVLKVPKSELLINADVNSAISYSADRAFWQKTVIPQIRNVESGLKANFIPGLRGTVNKNLRIVFDLAVVPALQGDFNEKVKNAEILARIGYPINAINNRLELGMPRVEWGDLWYTNSAIASIEQILAGVTTEATKPSHPTVPGPDVAEPMEPVEPQDPEKEKAICISSKHEVPPLYSRGVLPRRPSLTKRIPISQPLHTTPRLSYAEMKKTVLEPAAKAMKEELRTFMWRLRAHQLSKLSTNQICALYDRETLEIKLAKRLAPIYIKCIEGVRNALGTALVAPLTMWPNAIIYAIENELSKVALKSDDPVEAVTKCKEVFSRLSEHGYLSNVAKLEIGRVVREVEKGLMYEAQAV